VDSVPQ